MSRSAERRRQIDRLLIESEELEDRLAKWQTESAVTDAEIRQGQRAYHEWYARAQSYVSVNERDTFCNMYEGGQVIRRIKAFLTAPLEVSQLYDPSNGVAFMSKWAQPFDATCLPSFVKQRQLLTQVLYETTGVEATLAELAEVFRRLPDYIASLESASNPNTPAPVVASERDLQVVTDGILRLLFRNVIAEDPIPKKSGASSRTDFVIKDEGVLIETKMIRKTLTDKKVGDELLIDWGRYPRYPDIRGVFAIIYDPRRLLENPVALEDDLTENDPGISMKAIVVR